MNQAFPKPSVSLLVTIYLLPAIEMLQSGMILFAAGPIMGEIGATPEEFSLAMACYACVAIVTISRQRWLVERLGWKRYVQLSIAFFVLGAAICAGSISFSQFLIGRAVMGLGGAAFLSSGRIIVNLIPPSPMRFVGIKYFASGLATGLAFSPWLASLAVSNDQWNAIFGILAAMAITTCIFASIALPTNLASRKLRSQTHPILFMCLAIGSFVSLYVLQRFQYDFYTDLIFIVSCLTLASFAFYYYFRAMHRHERPFFQELNALKNKRYLRGLGLFTFCYILHGATSYILPIFMQQGLGFPWHIAGQYQTLGLLSALVGWLIMTWVMPRWPGGKRYFAVGFFALACFGWSFSRLNGFANLWADIFPALCWYGLFMMIVMPTTAMQTFSNVQQNEATFSNANQIKNMAAQLGTAMGFSLGTIFMQWRNAEQYGVLNAKFNSQDATYSQLIQHITELFTVSVGPQRASGLAFNSLAQQLNQQSTLMACFDYFSYVALVGVIGILCTLLRGLIKRKT